jgi:hypothetical protein
MFVRRPEPCSWCRRIFPSNWSWYACNECGYRVCAACLDQQNGRFGRGFKCGQCVSGFLELQTLDRPDAGAAAQEPTEAGSAEVAVCSGCGVRIEPGQGAVRMLTSGEAPVPLCPACAIQHDEIASLRRFTFPVTESPTEADTQAQAVQEEAGDGGQRG